jgi:hypothetical protein
LPWRKTGRLPEGNSKTILAAISDGIRNAGRCLSSIGKEFLGFFDPKFSETSLEWNSDHTGKQTGGVGRIQIQFVRARFESNRLAIVLMNELEQAMHKLFGSGIRFRQVKGFQIGGKLSLHQVLQTPMFALQGDDSAVGIRQIRFAKVGQAGGLGLLHQELQESGRSRELDPVQHHGMRPAQLNPSGAGKSSPRGRPARGAIKGLQVRNAEKLSTHPKRKQNIPNAKAASEAMALFAGTHRLDELLGAADPASRQQRRTTELATNRTTAWWNLLFQSFGPRRSPGDMEMNSCQF